MRWWYGRSLACERISICAVSRLPLVSAAVLWATAEHYGRITTLYSITRPQARAHSLAAFCNRLHMLKYLGSECLENSLGALKTARATEVSVSCRTMPEEGVYCQSECYIYLPPTTLRELPALPSFRLGNGIDLIYWQCVV